MATSGVTINSVCVECGVEIRADSLFCYNCGKAVAERRTENGLDTRLKDVPEKLNRPSRPTQDRSADHLDGLGLNGSSLGGKVETAAAAPGQPLKKPKPRVRPKRGPKDVVWQAEDGPGISYFLIVMGIAVLVAILLALAYYLK